MRGPGRLLASGRDCDVFEAGPGLVLRRSRVGRSQETEARTMAYVRDKGYPAPAADSLSDDGLDLVMERVDGDSMATVIGRRPWALGRYARLLADLHHRLHGIPAPDWLGAAGWGTGDGLLHLDLHPLNVIIGPTGPVVIDWPNAARGDGSVDVAVAWTLLACGGLPFGRVRSAVLGRGRAVFVSAFLRGCDRTAARRYLPRVVEWKANDANMTAAEVRAMWQLAEKHGVRDAPR